MGIYLFAASSLLAAPPEVWREIEQLHNQIADVSFIFEGEHGPHDGTNWIGATTAFTGRGGAHKDSVFSVERHVATEFGVYKNSTSIRRGGKMMSRTIRPDPRSVPQQSVRAAKSEYAYAIQHLDQYIFLYRVPWFRLLPGHILDSIHDEGEHEVDGRKCRLLRFTHDNVFMELFWFDLERGGNVLRVEEFVKDKLFIVLHSVKLEQIRDSNGKQHWFPVAGLRDRFGKSDTNNQDWIARNKVTHRTVYRIVPESIKLNTGKSSRDYELKLTRDSHVIDEDKMDLQQFPKSGCDSIQLPAIGGGVWP